MTAAARLDDDALDQVFFALANRTRRAMLLRLAQGTATVTELAEPFGCSLPTVSKHLKVLEGAGLVARDVEGRVHHCSLDPARLQDVHAWLAFYQTFWQDKLAALAAFVEDPE